MGRPTPARTGCCEAGAISAADLRLGAGGRPPEGRGNVTAERDGKSRRTDQPDLLASLPDERPPASQPAPGIDPAAIEELVTGVRDLREQFAGLKGSGGRRPACASACGTDAGGARGLGRQAREPVSPRPRGPRTRQGTTRRQLVSKGLRTRRRRRKRRQSASMGDWKALRTGLWPRSRAAVTTIEARASRRREPKSIQQSRQVRSDSAEEHQDTRGRAEVRLRGRSSCA